MTLQARLWALEEKLWTAGAEYYREQLDRAGAWKLAFHQQTPHLAEGAASRERLSA